MKWTAKHITKRPVFLSEVSQMVKNSGYPFFDAHGHLDREMTMDDEYYAHANINSRQVCTQFSLPAKQNLVGELHKGKAYQDLEDMEERMRFQLVSRRECGIGRFDTCIDVTTDIGLTAFELALRLREESRENDFDLHLGAYPLFGFKDPDDDSDRLDIFLAVVERAQFLVGLPERDDAPGHFGFEKHLKKMLETGIQLKKPVHFHVDQTGFPNERGTERLISAVRILGSPEIPGVSEPTVWAVHVISPSSYPEGRFWKLVEDLKELNIGVICCPRAAVSMRQMRCYEVPMHNSIARILEMMYAGVWVRLGSDNVGDIFVPTGKGDLLDEIAIAVEELRFYALPVWCKLATGQPLNRTDWELVRIALTQQYELERAKYKEMERQREQILPPWTLPKY